MGLPSPIQSPTLSGLIQGLIDSALGSVRTSGPARVEAYDPASQTVTVQLLIQDGHYDASAERQTVTPPPIPDCAVVFLGGSQTWQTNPIEIGSTGLAIICDRSTEQWFHAEPGTVVDPKDDRRHALSDAFFIPGLRASKAAIPGGAHPTAWVIHAAAILLGSRDATDPVVRQSDLQLVVDKLNHFIATFNGHGHATAVPSTPGTFLSTKPSTPIAVAAPAPISESDASDATGSSVVKVL